MDTKKLAHILYTGGMILLFTALFWWANFYSPIVKGLGGNLSDAFSCLYSSGGACGIVGNISQMTGKTPYSPYVFWIGALGVAVGGLMKATFKSQDQASPPKS